MTTRPRVKRHYHVEVIAGEAAYLVSDREVRVLEGDLVHRVVPYLNGKHDTDAILDELADIAPERVLYVVEKLRAEGLVTDADPDAEPRAAAYHDLSTEDGDAAAAKVAAATVATLALGEVDAAELTAALRAAGIGTVEPAGAAADLTVVVTDDYLAPGLSEVDSSHRESGRPWLLAKPIGSILWLGPVFVPGETACWQCLADRLRRNRQTEEYVRRRAGRSAPLPTALGDLAITRAMAHGLIATTAVNWLAGARADAHRDVLTLDTVLLDTTRHVLHARPQCAGCGDPGLMAEVNRSPVAFTSRPKRYTADGGHRAKRPDEVLATYEHLVSPITGVVRELRPFDAGLPDLVKGYVAGHNFARDVRSLAGLRSGLRSQACGKGLTDAQAKASAICEAIERYSGVFQGDEARRTASLAELGDEGINPNACMQFSDAQYAGRKEWNARHGNGFQTVADPFPVDARMEWTPVWSVTGQRHRYLPTSYLYFHYPLAPGECFAWADSNGNAAGSSLEDATLQGFLELVERDAVALWWYNRVRRPGIDLGTFGEPWFDELRETYARVGRDVWVLDLTTDFGIPVVAALSRRVDKPVEDILLAFGAHLDPRIAVTRALSELNQFLPAVVHVKPDGTGYAFHDPAQLDWWRTAKLADHPHLAPDPAHKARRAGDYPTTARADLRDDLVAVQGLVESAGLELLVLNQTRPDVGLPVVKVIVPGMRHFWARFAPGRLYDVPVRLGWLAEPTPEADLNPIPMFV